MTFIFKIIHVYISFAVLKKIEIMPFYIIFKTFLDDSNGRNQKKKKIVQKKVISRYKISEIMAKQF
jgi:hypothetical protein